MYKPGRLGLPLRQPCPSPQEVALRCLKHAAAREARYRSRTGKAESRLPKRANESLRKIDRKSMSEVCATRSDVKSCIAFNKDTHGARARAGNGTRL